MGDLRRYVDLLIAGRILNFQKQWPWEFKGDYPGGYSEWVRRSAQNHQCSEQGIRDCVDSAKKRFAEMDNPGREEANRLQM